MRIMGVDPGLTRCGYGIVDGGSSRQAKLVDVGVITSNKEAGIALRLLEIKQGLEAIIELHAPDFIAVERVFSHNNVSTVMGTAQVSGIALMLAAERQIPVAMHTPPEVKRAITGNGRADKAQIQNMVKKILQLDFHPRPADAADALAIAITQLWRGVGVLRLDAKGRATTSAQAKWAEAERIARFNKEKSTSRL